LSKHAISVENLVVRGRRKTILSIDWLDVRRGEFLGVLGPNAAGKTTLLRSCLGMQRYTKGHVTVLGQQVGRLGFLELARLRRRAGYVPQLLPVHSEMPLTVREVVAIGRTGVAGVLSRLSPHDWRIIDEWIDRLGLTSLAQQGYGEISGGEQRKTLIARAMVQQPEILLLDEPTANLDLGWRERIVEIVEELYLTLKISILLVCHELEVLPASCRRVAVLQEGKLIADGPSDEVLTNVLLESLYGPGLSILHDKGRYAVVPGAITHV